MPKRLFVALDLPDPIAELLAGLDPQLPKLRWIPADELHLTLSFLGEIDADATERLEAALAEVSVPPFFLQLQEMKTFDRKGQPTSVWVGVGNGHPHLFALHRQVLDAVLKARLEPDLRPLTPHVTGGRARGLSREQLQPFLRQHAEAHFGTIKVDGFTLYSSLRRPTGPIYTPEMHREFG